MELSHISKMRIKSICDDYISYKNNVQTLMNTDIYTTVLTIELLDEFYQKFLNAFHNDDVNKKTWDRIYEHEIKLATSPLPRLDVRLEYSATKHLFVLQCDTRSEFRSVCTSGKQYWHTCALIESQGRNKGKNDNAHIEFKLQFCPPDTEGDLNEDIEHLFNTKKFADAVIVSSDKEEFKVHRSIISGRSAVFYAMYTHDTAEARTGQANSPFEANVLHEVFTFIYSGKSPRLYELASQLLPAASYYQLKILTSMCEAALHYNLKIDNSLDTLQLAEEQDLKGLKIVALDFINRHAKAVVTLTGWPSLASTLVRELFEYSISNSENEVKEERDESDEDE